MAAFDGLYIDRAYMRSLNLIPAVNYEGTEDEDLAQVIRAQQDIIDSFLIKRYQAPYTSYVPPLVKYYLAVFTFDHLRASIGDIPVDTEDRLTKFVERGNEYFRMAADSKEGLAELLIRETEGGPGKSGVSRGGFKAITHRTPWDYQRSRRR